MKSYSITVSQKFSNILVHASLRGIYHVIKALELWLVVGALTCGALLHSMHDLKSAQMNIHCSLIPEFMLYNFKLQ